MNQVAEKKNSALATFDMEADAQQGAQNISQEDLALPFLKILGQLSPEVNKRDGKYVEGAEPGKIINTVTNELFDKISVGIDLPASKRSRTNALRVMGSTFNFCVG